MTEENPSEGTSRHDYELEQIFGLGRVSAEALYEIGIRTFVDLAQFDTPNELHQYLEDHGIKTIPLSLIENAKYPDKGNWLELAKLEVQPIPFEEDQSGELDRYEEEKDQMTPEAIGSDSLPSTVESGETEPSEEIEPSQLDWRPHAEFTVHFEYAADDQGERTWRTRIGDLDHYVVGEEEKGPKFAKFVGIETEPWVQWILAEAKLPLVTSAQDDQLVSQEVSETLSESDEAADSLMQAGTRLAVSEVTISELKPSLDVPEKRLQVEFRFQLYGAQAGEFVGKGPEFRLETYLVDTASGASSLVAAERGRLQKEVFEYTKRMAFPLPQIGQYQPYGIILFLPPDHLVAYKEGPVFNVVPKGSPHD